MKEQQDIELSDFEELLNELKDVETTLEGRATLQSLSWSDSPE